LNFTCDQAVKHAEDVKFTLIPGLGANTRYLITSQERPGLSGTFQQAEYMKRLSQTTQAGDPHFFHSSLLAEIGMLASFRNFSVSQPEILLLVALFLLISFDRKKAQLALCVF
jgi:hypothetical protein